MCFGVGLVSGRIWRVVVVLCRRIVGDSGGVGFVVGLVLVLPLRRVVCVRCVSGCVVGLWCGLVKRVVGLVVGWGWLL